jgi:hypothetical protein
VSKCELGHHAAHAAHPLVARAIFVSTNETARYFCKGVGGSRYCQTAGHICRYIGNVLNICRHLIATSQPQHNDVSGKAPSRPVGIRCCGWVVYPIVLNVWIMRGGGNDTLTLYMLTSSISYRQVLTSGNITVLMPTSPTLTPRQFETFRQAPMASWRRGRCYKRSTPTNNK